MSVLTPYYETGPEFEETVRSVVGQSLQNWEWIIVDDGSTDPGAVARLDALALADARVRILRQSNAGPGAARNAAFRLAQGRYVCLLDSDDMLEPTYLEKAVWFLESNRHFAFCNAYSVFFGDQQFLWTTGFERGAAFLEANSGPPISVIRRSAFAECGGFDESIKLGHEDWDFWLAMARAGHWGHTLPEFLQWYRKRTAGRYEQVMRTEGAHKDFERFIRAKYAGLEKHFPQPVISPPQPFETVDPKPPVGNPLVPGGTGRRILILLPWMVTGGADRVNLDLVEGLTSRGHHVTICATLRADHRWEGEFSRFTPDIFVLPNFLRAVDQPRFLSYLIGSRQIDTVVVTGSTLGYLLLPYLRSVAPGVAFVDLAHVEEPHWLNGGHPRFGVGYQNALELNVTTTGALKTWMVGRGADPQRIRVLYTGVRAPAASGPEARGMREAVRAELGLPLDVPVIVFAGRLVAQKRPALLARILRDAREAGLNFRAIIIGDGELRQELDDLLQQYSLGDRVVSLRALPHARWMQVLVSADILLMPSQYEGISIALLEAMAAGVVPLVAKVGGQEEVVSEEAGILVAHGPDEVQVYVDSLRLLLGDGPRREAMAREAAHLAGTRFAWATMIDEILKIFDEAHALRVRDPRIRIPEKLGVELATQAVEMRRLNEALDWMWTTQPRSSSTEPNTSADLMTASPEALSFMRLAFVFSQTRLGRKLVYSRSLRKLGRKLASWMTRC